MMMSSSRSDEAIVEVHATPEELFDYLDDQTRLASHMTNSSKMMIGGRMTYKFDEANGRAVGSVIKLGGKILGLELHVEEVITEHQRPTRKAWETRGQPRILIMGAYRMGFEITPSGNQSNLSVNIRYERPLSLTGRLLSPILARMYARWCVTSMATDAAHHFS